MSRALSRGLSSFFTFSPPSGPSCRSGLGVQLQRRHSPPDYERTGRQGSRDAGLPFIPPRSGCNDSGQSGGQRRGGGPLAACPRATAGDPFESVGLAFYSELTRSAKIAGLFNCTTAMPILSHELVGSRAGRASRLISTVELQLIVPVLPSPASRGPSSRQTPVVFNSSGRCSGPKVPSMRRRPAASPTT
jgi:hypothetical protein